MLFHREIQYWWSCTSPGREAFRRHSHEQKNSSGWLCCCEFMKQPEKTSIIPPRMSEVKIKLHSSPEQLPSHTRLKDYSEHIQLGLLWGLWMSTLWCFFPQQWGHFSSARMTKTLVRTLQRKGLKHAHLLIRQQVNNQPRSHMWPWGLRAHHIYWHDPAFCTRHLLQDLNINEGRFISYLHLNQLRKVVSDRDKVQKVHSSWIANSYYRVQIFQFYTGTFSVLQEIKQYSVSLMYELSF